MIKAKINNGICEVTIEGGVSELKNDTLAFVRSVYEAMLDSKDEVKDAEKKAEEYKKFVCSEINERWDNAKKAESPEEALEYLLKALLEIIKE